MFGWAKDLVDGLKEPFQNFSMRRAITKEANAAVREARAAGRAAVQEGVHAFGTTPLNISETMKNGVKKDLEKMIGKEAKAAIKQAERGSFFYRIGNGQIFKGAAKKVGIGAAVLAGVGAIGLWASSSRRSRKELQQQQPSADDLAALEASLAAGPADGRAPNEWVSKVRPAAALGNPQIGPQQPAMTAVPGESVQDLNAPTPVR